MTQEIIPSSPYYGEGSPLSARELQRTTDLADAVEKATIGGDGGSIGDYTGLSYVISPEQEIIIIITGQYPGSSRYAWSAARRNPVTPEDWEIDPDGPSANYDILPAREINNRTDVPLLRVVRAWVSNQDGGMSLDFDAGPSGGGGVTVRAHAVITPTPFTIGTLAFDPTTSNFIVTEHSPGYARIQIGPAEWTKPGIVSLVDQYMGRGLKIFSDMIMAGKGLNPGSSTSGTYMRNNTVNTVTVSGEGSFRSIPSWTGKSNNYIGGEMGFAFDNLFGRIYFVQEGLAATIGVRPFMGASWNAPGSTSYIGLNTGNVSNEDAVLTLKNKYYSLSGNKVMLDLSKYNLFGGLATDACFAIAGNEGQSGTVGGCSFLGGIWVGGTHPGAGGGGGLSDGTYGDIIISGGGTVFTIGNLTISTGKIQDSAVTTPKIADGAVTTPKISNGAVTPTKLSGGTRALIAAYG